MTNHSPLTPWSSETSELVHSLDSNEEVGLADHQVEKLLLIFGHNKLEQGDSHSVLRLLLNQFREPMAIALVCAGGLSILLSEWIDGAAIFLIIILNVLIGLYQEVQALKASDALKKYSAAKGRVVRNGQELSVAAEKVVPGDILSLEAGDVVPADARVLKGNQLSVDESSLTGESLPVSKDGKVLCAETPLSDRSNMLHAGTALNSGSGNAVVTATGMKTELGKIATLLKTADNPMTPLQTKLHHVNMKLLMGGGLIILLMTVIGVLRHEGWKEIFRSAVGLAVAVLPEGLPTVVTIALAVAVRRLIRKKAIVKNLSAIETLGSTNIICTDKTGTLTTGQMTWEEDFVNEKDRDSFLRGLTLCQNADFDSETSSDQTELAILRHTCPDKSALEKLRSTYPRLSEWTFDSIRKRMSVAVKDGERTLYITKGSPESILEKCSIAGAHRKELEEVATTLASRGFRVLAVASKYGEGLSTVEEVESELVFLGFVSLRDPPKKESRQAVIDCQKAGIKIVMLTGDHPSTAWAIGRELGIVDGNEQKTLTGMDIEKFSEEELATAIENTFIFARVAPSHKIRLVKAMQAKGLVVAMTGDGVNDAPALKQAHIGVSMGEGGTEVARQASAMILVDNNFSTIVSAVKEGRHVFENIRRTVQFLLSTNVAEVIVVLSCIFLNVPKPFSPVALLMINLFTDGLPALALAVEPGIDLPPDRKGAPTPDSFFDRLFLKELFLVSSLMTFISLTTYLVMLRYFSVDYSRAFALDLLVSLCLFRSLSSRSQSVSYFQLPFSKWHVGSLVLPLIFLIFLPETDWYATTYSGQEFSYASASCALLLGAAPFLCIELGKFFKINFSRTS